MASGGHRRTRVLSGLVLATLALAALAQPASADRVNLVRNATASFDGYITDPSSQAQSWMRSHYFQMRGYPPYFERHALAWSPPPASFYLDAYAIYNTIRTDGMADRNLLAQHPDWVLYDASGNPLYIPWGCEGGSCPQYAADFGNPGWRAWWIEKARETFASAAAQSPSGTGYSGLFIDDVNMDFRVGNGNGDPVTPIDPRTGAPMTLDNWQRYMAEFLEQVRQAFPGVQITHNAIWWLPQSDPEIQRQIGAANVIELERGFNDAGLTNGGGQYGFTTLIRHIDWLHDRGKDVVLEPYLNTEHQAKYELASYLVVRRGDDAISSDFRANPPTAGGPASWWKGWSLDPGDPRGARHHRHGLWERKFKRGTAVVNPVGGRPTKISFNRPRRNLEGKVSRVFRLGPRRGDFFFKRGQRH
jgi:Hypothetical glycosyl hydrolase family 15